MKRIFISMLLFSGLVVMGGVRTLPVSAQSPEGKVMVTTTVKNGVVTNWNCGCPKNGETNAFAVDMNKMSAKFNDRERAEFNRLLNEFERVNGVKIQSQTNVRNNQTQRDEIKSTAVGPMSGPGQQLCDFLKRFL